METRGLIVSHRPHRGFFLECYSHRKQEKSYVVTGPILRHSAV
jgi:hypothetical protein